MSRSARRCARRFVATTSKWSFASGPTVASRSITSWRASPPVPSTSPALVITSTRRRSRTSRATTDAVASTATSNDASSCADGRTSRSTAARERQRASSWRIIRSPVRAVARQCTRRRSSPTSYSRSVRKSSPRSLAIAARAVRLAVGGHAAPGRDRRHDVVDARAHRELGLAGAGHDAPREPERIAGAHHERAHHVAAAPPRGDAVRGARGRAARERRHEEPRRRGGLRRTSRSRA